jgi:hypothetical protein
MFQIVDDDSFADTCPNLNSLNNQLACSEIEVFEDGN